MYKLIEVKPTGNVSNTIEMIGLKLDLKATVSRGFVER